MQKQTKVAAGAEKMLTKEDISILEIAISKKNKKIFSKILEKNDPDTIAILEDMAVTIKYARGGYRTHQSTQI